MASRTEQSVVAAAGMVQGIALAQFPAARTIFIDPSSTSIRTQMV